MKNQKLIEQLLAKLDALKRQHLDFGEEFQKLQAQLDELRQLMIPGEEVAKPKPGEIEVAFPGITPDVGSGKEPSKPKYILREQPKSEVESVPTKPRRSLLDTEKYIGENLISKIGIVITILGIGIGAKYAIDHDLISPLARIITGYVLGLGMLVSAIRLKPKYINLSAVLLSGAMCTFYLITYFAYSQYQFISQPIAFVTLTITTLSTVVMALRYDRQIIAILGMIGAYGVPFLLGDVDSNLSLLIYVALINAGIVLISLRKYWKPVVWLSFTLSWLIINFWSQWAFIDHQFGLQLVLLLIYFVNFYGIVLIYHLAHQKSFGWNETVMLLLNSVFFFATGYQWMEQHDVYQNYLGLFTVFNALIHFFVALWLYRRKLGDGVITRLVAGMSLVLLVAAVPIQLDGQWVTLLWSLLALLVFYLGRIHRQPIFEKLSYVLAVLVVMSLSHDWATTYHQYAPSLAETKLRPLFNLNFMGSLIVSMAFVAMYRIGKLHPSSINVKSIFWGQAVDYLIPYALIFSTFGMFFLEISNYWYQISMDYSQNSGSSVFWSARDLLRFKWVWLINYSMLYVFVLTLLKRKSQHKLKTALLYGLNIIILLIFLTTGLYTLGFLRDSYLEALSSGVFSSSYLWLRYLCFGLLAASLMAIRPLPSRFLNKQSARKLGDFIFFGCILWVSTAEMIHWLELMNSTQSYKLGISILWGIYSFILVFVGIKQRRSHLRMWALGLFGITLSKLFLYDITHHTTLSKTIVFIVLGILLLLTSYLYNRFKNQITDEEVDD